MLVIENKKYLLQGDDENIVRDKKKYIFRNQNHD
jgi:hypothetical protein